MTDQKKGPKLDTIINQVILSRLIDFKGNRTKTAKDLGIGIRTLQRRLKKLAAKGVKVDRVI